MLEAFTTKATTSRRRAGRSWKWSWTLQAEIRIHPLALDDMIQHARESVPDECCGLLIGRHGAIEANVRATNLRRSPTAYLIDPVEHFATIRRVRAEGRSIVGAYHSHPASPAVPSRTDVAEAHYPDFVYVIVSLETPATPDVRGFVMNDGNFVPVLLVPLPDEPAIGLEIEGRAPQQEKPE